MKINKYMTEKKKKKKISCLKHMYVLPEFSIYSYFCMAKKDLSFFF